MGARVPMRCIASEGRVSSEPCDVLGAKKNFWGEFWSVPADDSHDGFVVSLRELGSRAVHPEITTAQLANAIRSYPKKKSLGIDHWSVAELAALPEAILDDFVDVLNDIAKAGMWPRQMHLNLVALLGKPGGGERGIAKTPMLYRMWSRIVQKEVRDWEAAVVADWDCATVGSSAFKTALLRNYKAEIASALGESCAANLWDLHKFFDTVVPGELFGFALELGFPEHVLALGLDMHMAPRVIQLEGCCSDPIDVVRSILAGCGLSIPFTRAYLRTALQEVASASSADQTVYVDDVAQCASGTLSQVVEALVQAAVVFHRSVRRLKLTVSAKSVVCGSSPKLVRLLTGELRDLGITVKAAPSARDLGLSFSPGRKRLVSIQLKRISGTAIRFRNIGGLVKTNNQVPCEDWGPPSGPLGADRSRPRPEQSE